ncbi:MAG TPA: hypothetical protein VMI06_08775 [Terriglobia bacterium]|nr:hypothetical protein [Terriglobia bacterium]
MTNTGGGPEASTRSENRKSLKDQYRWQLWLIVSANTLFLYSVVQENAIKIDGLRAIFTGAQDLLPVGVALIVATVLNGLLSADAKACVVFLRWHHALPGHRAFSEHAVRDPRIDVAALEKICGGKLPTNPLEQNRTWYQMYKSIENDPAVRQAHRDYLFMRDYAGLSTVFIILYGAVGMLIIPSMRVGLMYLVVLAAQFVLVRQAACNYGARFVTTVLARKTAKDVPAAQPAKGTKGRTRGPRRDPAEP